MHRSNSVIALIVFAALTARAGEGVELSSKAPAPAEESPPVEMSLTPKASATRARMARFLAPQLPALAEQERPAPKGACRYALCYDAEESRIVYRGARQFMPAFDGLTPESISVRRDRIVFKYSFR